MTDYKQLCVELLDAIDHFPGWIFSGKRPVIGRARAALAEPEPEVEPTLREEFTMILNEARCNSPGRVIGNIELGRRLVAAVERFKRARPEPEGPTDTSQMTNIFDGTHYEWELEDDEGEWQAGGSANSLEDVQREGMRYLQTYAQNGFHKLIIRHHCTKVIQVITNG